MKKWILAAMFLLLASQPAAAKVVTAEGTGPDRDGALRAAQRNAVEQVVGTLSPQSADGTLLHSLGESNAGRGVPPRGVGTARRVCGATSPRRRAKARRRERGGVTEGRDAGRLGWSAARRGNSTRSALCRRFQESFNTSKKNATKKRNYKIYYREMVSQKTTKKIGKEGKTVLEVE